MKAFVKIFVFPIALIVQGCASNSVYGPIRAVQAGNIGGVKSCQSTPRGVALLEDRFFTISCQSIAAPTDEAKARAMLEAGFSLIDARCNDFFAQKVGTQLGVRTVKDTIAPVMALLTGVLAIVDFSSEEKRKDYESILSLGSVAALAGIKVYEDNFLFSADNIDNVRELTTTALKTHAQAARILTQPSPDTSLQYVIENQMICTPGKIRDLVKGAIANGRIEG